ncbi:FCD domain-containing protein [Roseovarius phycicola]|uniref:Pyruvate dehydrogenase complex repressor n=1 Tax=Roseovarius phycicola TaxID=3080976 RepID=A0ABZ2HBT2_9RHOB
MPESKKRPPAAETTARHIEDLILEGSLRPGESLPPERDMAEALDVSRPTLRNALKALEAKGLLSSAPNGGRQVAPLATSVTDPLLTLLEERTEMVDDYLELRATLERMAATLAARRATDVDREILSTCAQKIEAAHASGDAQAEAEADIDLHIAVYEASHNIVLLQIMRALSRMLRQGVFMNREKLYTMPEVRNVLKDQHLRIIETILSRDPEAAGEASEAHMNYTQLALSEIAEAEARLELSLRRIEGGNLSKVAR